MPTGLELATAAFGLANSALDGILKVSAISDKVAEQVGVERDLAFIHDEFAMMQAFLKAAEKPRGRAKSSRARGKVVDTWVRQVRVLAYDVEDCLEDSALHLRRQPCLRRRRALKARRRIASDIRNLRAQVEDVSKRRLRYSLVTDGNADALDPPAGDGGSAHDDDLSGAITDDDDADDESSSTAGQQQQQPGSNQARRPPESSSLANLITGGGGELRVISLWGRDDHGRAVTVPVVREAYDDPGTRASGFTWRAWVKVPHPFKPREFIKSLLSQLDDNDDGEERWFERQVEKNKFLFVLDDLAGAEEWFWIKTRLPDRRNGSRIVVRAQHQGIAMLCPDQPIQVLGCKSKIISDGDYELLYGHPPPPIYLIVTNKLGLEQSGSEKEAGFSTKVVAGESSRSTTEPKEEGQPNSGATRKQVDLRGSLSAALEDTNLVGREPDQTKVIDLVLAAKKQEYICVYGVDGIGKTALIKSICQNEKLHGMFERIATFNMRDPFSYHEFLRTVKQKLDPKKKKADAFRIRNKGNMRTDEKAGNVPLPDQRSKGNLIVLDDVSSKKDLDAIEPALLDPQINMSRVIITTREPSFAELFERRYNLKTLQDGDALKLFEKKVKVDMQVKKLSGVAKEIVAKCGGIPQVIITVAGSLQERPNIKEWERTRDRLSKELENDPKLKDTNRILTSGYKNLPPNLKSCFLYLSVFPEDSVIRRRCLVRRWIAEGYSSEKHGMSAEEVADKQFQDLISRNMIQPYRTTSKIGTSGESYFFEFQNLMHSISRKMSAKENLVLVLDENEQSSLHAKSRARHLTVMEGWSREGRKGDALESIVDLSCIRSLTVFGEYKPLFVSRKMRLLRVLDLEDTYGLRDHNLSSISKLYHLRYLSLRGSEGIFHLPDAIGNLLNLETLDVRGTMVTKLPSTIVKLQKLKYLRSGIVACNEDESCISAPEALRYYCSLVSKVSFSKETVYEGMEELDLKILVPLICLVANVWLRTLDPHGVEVPRGIGKLRALHTLGVVNVARGNNMLKEIEKLTQLRKLGITGISKNNCKGLKSIVSNSHLQSLSMRAEGNDGLVGCLDMDVSSGFSDGVPPLEDLRSLKLFGNLGRLPEWIEELPSLVKLTLRSTLLQRDAIEVLETLTNLTTLRLLDKSFKGDELHFRKGTFASLTVLEIGGLDNVKSVVFEKPATPQLKLLKVDCWWNWDTDCCSFTGIQHLESLKDVLLQGLYNGSWEENLKESDAGLMKRFKRRLAKKRAFKEELLAQLAVNQNKPILKME